MSGQIVQISISNGGVPKTAVLEAEIIETGVVGDRYNHPDIHGGPEKAVCLWSLDVIETLKQEGHNLAPGYAGENITVEGIDWLQVVPGLQMHLGDEVVLEIASYTSPCRQNMRWFADKRYTRMSQDHYPGSSRVYARVLKTGKIREGDAVVIASAAPSGQA